MKTKEAGAERGGVEGREEGDEGNDGDVKAVGNDNEQPSNDNCECELGLPEADIGSTICTRSVPAGELFSTSMVAANIEDIRY